MIRHWFLRLHGLHFNYRKVVESTGTGLVFKMKPSEVLVRRGFDQGEVIYQNARVGVYTVPTEEEQMMFFDRAARVSRHL